MGEFAWQIVDFGLFWLVVGLASVAMLFVKGGFPKTWREARGAIKAVVAWPLLYWLLWVYLFDRKRYERMMRDL